MQETLFLPAILKDEERNYCEENDRYRYGNTNFYSCLRIVGRH